MNTLAWKTLAPAIKLSAGTRCRIQVPAFDYTFLPANRGCLSFAGAALNVDQRISGTEFWDSLPVIGTCPLMTNTWSIDCWVKISSPGTANDAAFIIQKAFSTVKYIRLLVDSDRYLKVGLMVCGVVTTLVSGATVPIDEWCHVGITYVHSGGVRNVLLYVNGVAVRFTATIAVLDTDTDTDGGGPDIANQDRIVLGSYSDGASRKQMAFKMAMLRIWAIELPKEYFYYRQPNAYVLAHSDLIIDNSEIWGLWDFSTAAPFLNQVELEPFYGGDGTNADFVTVTGSGVTRDTSDGMPALDCHESYAVAHVPLQALAENFSLLYPVTRPASTTFSLFVTWDDVSGVTQMRSLWTDDLYVGPEIAPYAGERINYATAKLLVMSNFYSRTAVNPAAFNLETSCLVAYSDLAGTRPAVVALEPTDDVYEPFPLVFPLTFDQAKTY